VTARVRDSLPPGVWVRSSAVGKNEKKEIDNINNDNINNTSRARGPEHSSRQTPEASTSPPRVKRRRRRRRRRRRCSTRRG